MRYTTIIDISEYPDIYRNTNVRCVYLHLVLRSGWHDDDRDQYRGSLRRLAADTGLTLSAVRHALRVLAAHDLCKAWGKGLAVRKYVRMEQPTRRARNKREEDERRIAQEREQQQLELERQQAAAKEAASTAEAKQRAAEFAAKWTRKLGPSKSNDGNGGPAT